MNERLIKYVHSGLFVSDSEWVHPERNEVTYEIICVTDGNIHIEEEKTIYNMKKGDILILKPGVTHKGIEVSGGRTSFYWVHFTTDCYELLDISKNFINGFTNIAVFKQLLHIVNTVDYPDYAADAVLLYILAEISCFARQNTLVKKSVVYEAAEWIRINTLLKLKSSDVAERYGYSSEALSRMFKKIYSVSLKKYICDEQMKTARELLGNPSLSVKQISAMLSFDNPNQFINLFKYHQGVSPAKFRNSLYNVHMNKK